MSTRTSTRRQPAREENRPAEEARNGPGLAVDGAVWTTVTAQLAAAIENNRTITRRLEELLTHLDARPRPRAASPEGDAPAPDENGARIPPAPDAELARGVDWVLGYDNMVAALAKGEWIPSTPEAVGVALRLLAEEAVSVFDRSEHQQDTLKQITTHLTAAGKAASNA